MHSNLKNPKMQRKVFQFRPRWDSTEIGRISEGVQALSSLDQIPLDAT